VPLAALKFAITSSVVVNPDVAGTIITQAENTGRTEQEGDCILIAQATHGRRGLRRLLMGSVTERVLSSTRLPLLVVRPQEKAAGAHLKAKEKRIPRVEGNWWSRNCPRDAQRAKESRKDGLSCSLRRLRLVEQK